MGIYTNDEIAKRNPPAGGTPTPGEIWVPPWNDVIHLVDEKTLPKEEQLRRVRERIHRMKESPSPEIAKNIATILTAVDDVQDTCTTVGVSARLMEKAMKLSHITSKGAFTSGELLNSLNMMNKIPFEKLSPTKLLKMVKSKKIDLDKLSPTQLKAMERKLSKIHPDWSKLSIEKKKQFMRDNYKITRKRWGMPLKQKKRLAEGKYSKGTPFGKLRTQVDRRLKRVLPNQGELLEMGQTSDMVAGVGISFGPIVGFAMDAVFGVLKGAPLKFSEQKISPEEMAAIGQIGWGILKARSTMEKRNEQLINALPQMAYVIASGESLPIGDNLKAMYAHSQAYITMRGKELWHATTSVWEKTKNWIWKPGPHTSNLVKEALLLEGIDPNREESWPGIKLKREAPLQEVSEAYLEKIQENIKRLEAKLSKDVKGEFLASCLSSIALNTCCATCEEGGVITETFTDELRIYTRATDLGLEPPIYATDEEFAAWHSYILKHIKEFDLNGPEYNLLVEARKKFWPPELIIE